MPIIKQIKTTDNTTYDIGAKYDVDGNEIKSTYAKSSQISTVNNGKLTIQKNGATKGTFTANQSSDTTINITTNADEITSGYFKNQIYINSHPENSPCIVPFLYNDLAFIRRRSGSYHAYTVASNVDLTATTLTPVTDWTTTGLDNAFDGSPSYCTLNSTSRSLSDSVKLVIDIVCPQRFAYSNVFYIDFGAANWRAKNIEVLVSDSDLPSKLYTSKLTKTGNSYGNYYGSVSFSFTNSGGTTVQGFNRMRIVLDHFNSYTTSSPRISQIGIINYGSSGVRNTYMSRGLDDGIYRNLNPSSNKGYSLGTSSLQWNTIYGGSIYENGTALSSKYLGISSKAADADKLDGQDSSYYQPKLPTNSSGFLKYNENLPGFVIDTTSYATAANFAALSSDVSVLQSKTSILTPATADKGKYLHVNSTSGALEWSEVQSSGGNVTGSNLTANQIIFGNGNSAIKASGYTISNNATDSSSVILTSAAIYSAFAQKVYDSTEGTGVFTDGHFTAFGDNDRGDSMKPDNHTGVIDDGDVSDLDTKYFNTGITAYDTSGDIENKYSFPDHSGTFAMTNDLPQIIDLR